MASLIAEGIEFGKAAPVVFVSSEEVSIFLNLVLANQHACFKASLCSVLTFLLSSSYQAYHFILCEKWKKEGILHPNGIGRGLGIGGQCSFWHMVTTYASAIK
ncbi:unnamed protein product [Prunus brigantina]